MANEEQVNDNAWPIADPDFTLRALGQLKGVALPNGKAFYKSYTKWATLNGEQRNKATAYFQSLSDAVKVAVKVTVLALEENAQNNQHQQAALTSANDRARFMHAMVDPINQVALTEANSPLPRGLLDTPDERRAAWDRFAENFNNYELCIYQNATVLYVNGLQVNPYQALPNMETMATFTHNINPSDDARPMRDGAWCEKMWKEVRGTASRINENYRQSGNQDVDGTVDSMQQQQRGACVRRDVPQGPVPLRAAQGGPVAAG